MFGLFGPNIEKGLREYRECENGVLIDVRTEEEFQNGRIPGSINVPLDKLNRVKIPNGKLFIYCHSGGRSAQACNYLKRVGRDATNIGGIASYKGEIER